MPLTIELLHTGVSFTDETNLTQVVQKRLDYIRYGQVVPNSDIGVEFLGWEEVRAEDVLNIVDLSASIPENSALVYRNTITTIAGLNVKVDTLDVKVTDKFSTKSDGEQVPLFYRHRLDTTSSNPATVVTIQRANADGSRVALDPWYYQLSSNGLDVFTSITNWFDEETGRYDLYYVQWLDSSGKNREEILDAQQAYREAVIEDLDPDTGLLMSDSLGYVISTIGTKYILTMSHSATWFVSNTNNRFIYLISPTLDTINDPWFISVHNGNFKATIDSVIHHYYIPEWEPQNFNPIKPYLLATLENCKKITPSILKLQREDVLINPDDSYHLDVILSDTLTGDVEYALTTDRTKNGDLYSDTAITFDSTVIEDWDQSQGIVTLNKDILWDRYTIKALYYYKSTSYEYTDLNLNPLQNPDIMNYMIVFYIVPDVPATGRAINYLLVQDNVIVFTSQEELAEFNEDGSYNPDTIVGLFYKGAGGSGSPTFSDLYPEYLVLGEINPVCSTPIERDLELDTRVNGGGVDPEHEDEAIKANPRIAYIPGVAPNNGYEYPRYGSMVVHVPYTLHIDYGGELTLNEIKNLVHTNMSAGEYAIIKWAGTIPKCGCAGEKQGVFAEGNGCVRLSWYKEDPSYRFKIYKSTSLNGEYSLHATVSPGSGDCNELIICGLNVGETYFFYITALSEDNIESPRSTIQGVRVY